MTSLAAVLVTGASSGIGAAFAPLFAREKARLVLSGRDAAALKRVAEGVAKAGAPDPLVVVADLAEAGAVDALLSAIAAAGLHVDELVNNAGYGLNGAALSLPVAGQLGIVDVNVRAATELALKVLPGMVARGRGGVLNVASMAGFLPGGPHMAVYYASKAYLLSLSEALTEETKGTGVRVTALCPGPTRTDFGKRAGFVGNSTVDAYGAMTAAEVARAGFSGFRAGLPRVVPGARNALVSRLVGLVPRGLALRLVGDAQRRRGEGRD